MIEHCVKNYILRPDAVLIYDVFITKINDNDRSEYIYGQEVESSPSSDLAVPEVVEGLVRAVRRDEVVSMAGSPLRHAGDHRLVLVGQLPVEDVHVLLHPALVEAPRHHAHALLVHPP